MSVLSSIKAMKAMKANVPMKAMKAMKANVPMTAMKALKATMPMKANAPVKAMKANVPLKAMKAMRAMKAMNAMKAMKAMNAMKTMNAMRAMTANELDITLAGCNRQVIQYVVDFVADGDLCEELGLIMLFELLNIKRLEANKRWNMRHHGRVYASARALLLRQ